MGRWIILLLFLPVCLILQDQQPPRQGSSDQQEARAVAVSPPARVLHGTDLLRQHLLAGLATNTSQSFPGALPWGAMHNIGESGLYPVDFLIHYHPPLFLEMCLERYEREVRGYSVNFLKQEKVKGKMRKPEELEVHFREKPFSVFMHWLPKKEGDSLAQKALYVEGENDNKLLARGRGILAFGGIQVRDVDGADAKSSSRYTIAQYGIKLAMQRTVAAMRQAEARGALFVQYHGLFEVPQLKRVCHKFVRTPYVPPEEEGVYELTIYIDKETWLQVGSILKDEKGELIAEYYFRDFKLNPEFKKDQFQKSSL